MIRLLYITIGIFLMASCHSNHSHEHSHEHGQEHAHEHAHDQHEGHDHDHDATTSVVTDTLEKQYITATATTPAYIQLATNIEIVENIDNAIGEVGVPTHEGIFGPLLFAEDIRAFFIRLEPGMFLAEHPHPTESIVYTVKGKWVLCSEAKRQVMEAGSLFHFGSNMPTGWEAPFEEGAMLLIVKSKAEGANFENYMDGLRDLAAELDAQYQKGGEFYFNQLDEDHPAMIFARQVNPNFDQVLQNINEIAD